ncbi:MAG: protein TolA, partial [Oxalobacteraceae bacterium]
MKEAIRHHEIPAEPGRLRALGLALLVHLVLLGFLWFGVSWQSDTPTVVEAEIWNPVAREAAPPPPPPPPPQPLPEPPKPTV